MSGAVYIKEGRSLRLEIENDALHELSLRERGKATEGEGMFESVTLEGQPRVDPSEIVTIPSDLTTLLQDMRPDLERATLVTGAAHHDVVLPGQHKTWRDTTVRLHASVTNRDGAIRCELDRGNTEFDDRWITELLELRQSMASYRPGRRISTPVCLEPEVSAAVIASIWLSNHRSGPSLAQVPRSGELDGYGRLVEERDIESDRASATWFRPSYRTPPRQIPHGLDLADPLSGGDDAPDSRALALLAPPRVIGNVVHLSCLVQTDEGSAGARLEIELTRWSRQIRAVGGREQWFPFLAGVWGRRLLYTGSVSPIDK